MTNVFIKKNMTSCDDKTQEVFSLGGQSVSRIPRTGLLLRGTSSFVRPLNAIQILEAFPDEARKLVPKNIRLINKKLKYFVEWIEDIFRSDYDNFTKWFIIKVGVVVYGPKEDFKQLARLKKMRKMLKPSKNSKYISSADIEKAKEIPISHLIEYKKTGRRLMASCPLHIDKTPSLLINDNGTAKCFSCQTFFKDVIDFAMKTQNLEFVDAVNWLIKQ